MRFRPRDDPRTPQHLALNRWGTPKYGVSLDSEVAQSAALLSPAPRRRRPRAPHGNRPNPRKTKEDRGLGTHSRLFQPFEGPPGTAGKPHSSRLAGGARRTGRSNPPAEPLLSLNTGFELRGLIRSQAPILSRRARWPPRFPGGPTRAAPRAPCRDVLGLSPLQALAALARFAEPLRSSATCRLPIRSVSPRPTCRVDRTLASTELSRQRGRVAPRGLFPHRLSPASVSPAFFAASPWPKLPTKRPRLSIWPS